MSTKTLRKRIALVAVSALGAGLLSVVAVPSANAADNVAPGTSTPALAAGVLNIGTTAVATKAVASTSTGAQVSVGLVAVSDLSGTRVAGTTQTAVLLSTGTLSVATGAPGASTIAAITVEGGTISESTTGATNASSNASAAAANTALGVLVRPASGVSTMTVRLYTAATSVFADAATAATFPTLGTLQGQITVTIASASESGVMVPAKSKLYYVDETASGTDNAKSSDADAARLNLGGLGCVNVQLNDGYGQDITSTTGLLTATATNNALIAFAASNCAKGTVPGSAFYTSSPADVVLSVASPSSAPLSTTVTISYNGVVVGTKSFVIRGKVAKVTISGDTIGKTGAANASAGSVKFEDAAGNTVYPTSSSTPYPLNSNTFLLSPSAPGKLIASAAIDGTVVPDAATGVTGAYQYTCAAGAYGKEKFSMIYVNTDGTIVTSNSVDNSCAGAPVFYSAAWDKDKYAPGELMKLNITLKDAKGNLANEYEGTGTSSQDPKFEGAPNGGVNIGTAADGTDTGVGGVLSYKFIAGTTEGTFAAVISLPGLNSVLTGQTSQATKYTIAATSTGVTNAEVLKAIVSLIASINKQIAALQKALLKK